MAGAMSVILLLVGFISLKTLPVEQYPDIAPPTVYVSATYTGADASAVMNSVIMPLEEAINGVEDMLYITSTATNSGTAEIQVYFKQGADADMAAVNVQNRVSRAQGLLPSEVTRIGVSTVKRQNSMLQISVLSSPDDRYDESFLANYLDINVVPRIKRIPGVGEATIMGDTYSLRIWLNPDLMAQYGLVPSDISNVLAEQNVTAPFGSLGENSPNTYLYTMKYKGRLKSVPKFEEIVIQSRDDGSVLKLKDVAKVELGRLSYAFEGKMNGHPSCQFMIMQTAGANSTEVNSQIDALKAEIQENELPAGCEFQTMMTTNDFLYASIHNVVETLVIAILLVILVVYFFLHDFRSTLIPAISIIVSLVGTFACMYIAGYSINILTLFALVLAIGTVVDDSIVVVEAVQAKFDAGYTSRYYATKDAMSDVTMAVITCTAVFMAVFIPVTFMGGTSGKFYTQFGITMAVAVGLSCLNALTLCPALCVILMHPKFNLSHKSFKYKVTQVYNVAFNATMDKYKRALRVFLKRPAVSFVLLAVAGIFLVFFMMNTKTSLVPQEDQGAIMIDINTVPGSTVKETSEVVTKIADNLGKFPEVLAVSQVSGYGIISGQGTSYGMVILKLKPWGERKGKEHSSDAILSRVNQYLNTIKEAQCLAIQPSMIPGYGSGSSITAYIEDRQGGDPELLYKYSMHVIGALNQRPEIMAAYTSYSRNFPQYDVDIDAAECKRAGISPTQVLDVVGAYCGGSYVSNYNEFGKVYRVMIQAAPEYRLDEPSLNNMYVRNGNTMAPASQFAKLKPVAGPEQENRFNLYSSIALQIMPAVGYSTGEAMKAFEETANQILPQGYGFEYGGMSREEAQMSGSNQTLLIYALCIFLIYLLLSCLYESWLVPLSVILSVPFGIMGSFWFAWMMGLENNIYLQTGIIMLIGLLCKTAILITEFALDRRRKGMDILHAAYAAAKERLRPILMTVLTMIFGMLPLMFSTGAGSNGNSSLGTGVVGGLLVGTLALLFVVPVFFIVFEKIQERIRKPLEVEEDLQVSNEHLAANIEISAFNPENN